MKIGKIGAWMVLATLAAGSVSAALIEIGVNSPGYTAPTGITERVSFGGDWTNYVTTASGTRTEAGRWRLNSDHVITVPSFVGLSVTGQAYTALGVAEAFDNNNANFGVEGGLANFMGDGQYIEVTFSQDVRLIAAMLGDMNDVGDDFNIAWNASSVDLVSGDRYQTYTFAADTVLTAGSVLTFTGNAVGEGASLDGFVVETIPEPATIGMVGFAGLVLALVRRLRG